MSFLLHYKNYKAEVEYDEEVELFTGSVLNLPYPIYFQSPVEEELDRAFEEAVEDYLILKKHKQSTNKVF